VAKKGELVYGVGINDADYSVYRTEKVNGKRKVVWHCPFYKMWSNMMRRAYDHKYKEKYPTYSDVCVAEHWHRFSNFKSWCSHKGQINGKQLDKDLKIPENKIYGPHTCLLVPSYVNSLFTDRAALRGELPLGVVYMKDKGNYMAQIQLGIKRGHKTLGRFSSAFLAHRAWQEAKIGVIDFVIESYKVDYESDLDQEVLHALIHKKTILMDDIENKRETIKL